MFTIFSLLFLLYKKPFFGNFVIITNKSRGMSDESKPYKLIGEFLFSSTSVLFVPLYNVKAVLTAVIAVFILIRN